MKKWKHVLFICPQFPLLQMPPVTHTNLHKTLHLIQRNAWVLRWANTRRSRLSCRWQLHILPSNWPRQYWKSETKVIASNYCHQC